ncbi:glycoside hydrolase/deacetylase [Marasmius fiardii PR-910]|nr:glycoside hydrolase/deacetylase [Marasmius fiardii PR-910]
MFINAVVLASLLSVVSALDRTTVAEQSAIKDPVEQCELYNFPPIENEIPKFPEVFKVAKILPNDAAARAKFDEISKNIPKIAPKVEADEESYDVDKDPDCWWTETQCTQAKTQGIPADISLVPEPETLGFGFDDGPNCSHNAFYDYLTEQKQKATMFFIGSNVLAYPLQTKRAMDDGLAHPILSGHEICVHTWSHPAMTSLSNEDAFAEIYYTMQAIKLITGATPTCFRPPFGDIDDRIRAISKGLGLTNILWKFDTFDTVPGPTGKVEDADIQKNYQEFIKLAKNGTFSKSGAILLAHETNNQTMQEAIDFYPQLKSAFKHIVPIGVAHNKTQPYVEKDFVFPDFAKYIATEPKTVQNGTSKAVSTISSASGSGSTSTTAGASTTSSSSTSTAVVTASSATAVGTGSGGPVNPANNNGAGAGTSTTVSSVQGSETADASNNKNIAANKDSNGAESTFVSVVVVLGSVMLVLLGL